MKKIKIFKHGNEMILEEYVNQFLAEHPVSVSDIQYRMPDDGKYSLMYSVMIVYDPTLAKADKREREHYERVVKAGESN